MEIKRLKNNQIRCALTEDEIEEMGFHIDDIIGNGEVTQQFMKEVLDKVEELEQIDVDMLSPMVRAELLQDHSMAITFGGITEEEKKGMFGKIMEMMEQMAGKNPEKPKVEDLFTETKSQKASSEEKPKCLQLGLECKEIEDAVRISKLFSGKLQIPSSAFYKMDEKYYLLMDFAGIPQDEMRPLAFTAVEYENRRIATEAGIAYIREHGTCIISEDAIRDLIQL